MEIVQTHETEDDAAGKEQDHEPTESPLADPINVGASRPDDTGKNSKESSTTPRRVATPKRKRSDTAASSKPASSAGLPSWLAQPLVISASLTPTPSSATTNPKFGLSPSLTTRLAANGVTHLFPVQQAVLPRLLATRRATSAAATPPQDLLVAAPTGSGKTLAYVLPVVEMLSTRCVIRLRALVVVPTRDLAVQAKAAFESVVSGSASASAAPLRVAVVTGAASFAAEQAQLVSQRSSTAFSLETNGPSAGSSRVDILIATPGRLTDHIRTTPGFTLRHLRFLIVDEADRLMNQRFQGWLDAVLASAMVEGGSRRAREAMGVARKGFERYFEAGGVVDYYSEATEDGKKETRIPLQKLLFSATLTRNPSKIAALHLNNPLYISVMRSETSEAKDMDSPQIATVEPQTRYSVPSTLFERMLVVGSPSDKPVALLHLLYNLTYADLLNAATKAAGGVLIFAHSVESAQRLAALLQFVHPLLLPTASAAPSSSSNSSPIYAAALTSDLGPAQRRHLLFLAAQGALPLLVSSDLAARGLDLSSTPLPLVLNYTVPARLKTYIHRVGRTARAGRLGLAVTLLESKEARWFK
ncbi:P-loop containing nucleoside triphosphate hydrolase protein, partial [Zopfochytrium polystomum]